MEEIEVPTEHLHENINEKAHEANDKWSMLLAISTAIMAVFAALASLLAGHHSNEALLSQLKASDQWNYYQAKGIKYEITQGIVLNNPNAPDDLKKKLDKYKDDQAKIKETAEEAEKESVAHLEKHSTLARSVTLFQISIAISAIAMLTRRRFLWYFSLILSAVGIYFFVMGNL
jgi:hypothetical protein